ncbi:NUDIX domain-containing protein [Alishewanella sp. SMS8]|uniref:NUDIX domain-containing protein n=1 Tax=Alishewanella sp. SMS8 TaxID=2994676 RepID=UPI0027415E6A|nr:NUDIX domain-containing protein [Alishewanella sp. SMS8]MDP4944277.1 NUDIX domain-containing protein [Alishewanella sp.]MDP5206096.1 NUDIX domain-containing protein [Alishewanella sp. SMS9]MDP5034787.1 NUDIX domain-containing protein [Alishewanella sp.]MDP5185602.1 NUDIX domain-containing protein [Alishewanella sp.]MDP5459650.1 NUDIX domain-containing protein [Alishewanella sp. SMS8]
MSQFKIEQYPSFQAEDLDIIDKTTVFQGFFRIERWQLRHKLFAGGWSQPMIREVFERGQAVIVLPYNPQTDEVVLVEQFRVGVVDQGQSPWLLESIAGMIDDGQTAEQTAIREAKEEAGLTLSELWPMLNYFSSPGGSTEKIHLYLARLTQPVTGGLFGLDAEHEDIKMHVMPRQTAMQLLASGHINNAATVIGLQWLALHLSDVQQRWGTRLA